MLSSLERAVRGTKVPSSNSAHGPRSSEGSAVNDSPAPFFHSDFAEAVAAQAHAAAEMARQDRRRRVLWVIARGGWGADERKSARPHWCTDPIRTSPFQCRDGQ